MRIANPDKPTDPRIALTVGCVRAFHPDTCQIKVARSFDVQVCPPSHLDEPTLAGNVVE